MTDPKQALPPARVAACAVVVYIVGVFVAAAVGTPWLYAAAQAAAAHAPVFAPLAAHPLHRYLQRLLLVFAVAGLPALLRVLGLRRWRDLGLASPRAHGRALARGAAIGVATVLLAAALPVVAGARAFDPAATPGRVAARVLTALAVAPVVACLEELLFRGVMYGGLRRAGASGGVLAASSAFYAGVHFLARPATPASVTWSSGFAVLGGMRPGVGHIEGLAPAFLALWLVGAYLGRLYYRAGTLFANVGVHAGGIFVLQLYGLVTTAVAGADRGVWGSGYLVDGWAALGVLLAIGGVGRVVRACRDRRIVPAPPVEIEAAAAA